MKVSSRNCIEERELRYAGPSPRFLGSLTLRLGEFTSDPNRPQEAAGLRNPCMRLVIIRFARQRDCIRLSLEDSEESLDLDLKDKFEREGERLRVGGSLSRRSVSAGSTRATVFHQDADGSLQDVWRVVILAAARKYVSTTEQPCALLVYEPPVQIIGQGLGAALRRAIPSTAFVERYGDIEWPQRCTNSTFLSSLLFPEWKLKESVKCSVTFGEEVTPCRFDAFNNGKYGYYVLAFPEYVRPPRRRGTLATV